MKETYRINIPGRPVTKSYGFKGSRMYPDQKTKQREEKIGNLWNFKHGVCWNDKEPLAFSVQAYYPDRRTGDLKNLIYLAEDALSEVAYGDDKQILMYKPTPFITFCEEGEERTEIFVSELEESDIKGVKDDS